MLPKVFRASVAKHYFGLKEVLCTRGAQQIPIISDNLAEVVVGRVVSGDGKHLGDLCVIRGRGGIRCCGG